MTKGTRSFGKRHTRIHSTCPRCGKKSFHVQKKTCSACGFPSPKIRSYNWSIKALRRKRPGTGRAKHLKLMKARERVNFRVPQKKASAQ